MKGTSKLSGFFSKKVPKVEIRLDLIEFQDKGVFYTYSPALDLIGYGKTYEAARESWQVVIAEYLEHAFENKTLQKDLEDHGWVVSHNSLNPPSFTWVLENNEQAMNFYNKHDFYKSSKPVKVPIAAICE